MPAAVWFTGLSGAGKSTLASAVATRLRAENRKVELLDGDAVRAHLCSDLGFSRRDRDKNVARLAYVANLLVRNEVYVLVAAISPYRQARDQARQLIGRFCEIHLATPLAVCIRRDAKGLYAKAFAGELENFTGVSDPYEEPLAPELRIDTAESSLSDCADKVMSRLWELGHLR